MSHKVVVTFTGTSQHRSHNKFITHISFLKLCPNRKDFWNLWSGLQFTGQDFAWTQTWRPIPDPFERHFVKWDLFPVQVLSMHAQYVAFAGWRWNGPKNKAFPTKSMTRRLQKIAKHTHYTTHLLITFKNIFGNMNFLWLVNKRKDSWNN